MVFLKIVYREKAPVLVFGLMILAGCSFSQAPTGLINNQSPKADTNFQLTEQMTTLELITNPPKTDDEWRKILTTEQFHILREKGTEAPFSSELDFETRPGTYYTADCHEPVFRSEQKYDSGTGWPSFWQPISKDSVVTEKDTSLFEERTEVLSKCGGHLGHVFTDGPKPTELRYCMNGDALIFVPDSPEIQ